MGAVLLMWWNTSRIKITLTAIFLVAFLIRFIGLESNPPGFTWDEAALGYNAYSILKTGKDEYGQPFPLIFKSFGDYKPGFYVYLDVPFIRIFGLNETATRLPSVILGSLIPVIAYFLVKELMPSGKHSYALISSILLTFSPWAIHFSRGAWETNIAFFLILLGTYFISLSRKKGVIYFALATLLFALSIYTYQSAKMFAVLLFLGLIVLFRQYFLKGKLRVWIIFLSLVLGLVLISSLTNAEVRSRLTVLNQYGYQKTAEEINLLKSEDNIAAGDNSLQFQLFHSHQLDYIRVVAQRYLNYFSPKFLFIDNPADGRQGTLGYGLMHLFELPFFLIGLYHLVQRREKGLKVILLWSVVAPIPAALSRDLVNTARSLPLIFTLELISAFGIIFVLNRFKTDFPKYFVVFPFVLIILGFLNFSFYLDKYYVFSRVSSSSDWLYGHKEVVEYIEQNKDKYNRVVFTTAYNEPYIFYLFYSRYDPAKYQSQAQLIRNSIDVGEVPRIDKISFNRFYWPAERGTPNGLYIGTWLELPDPDIVPKQATLVKEIKFLNGQTAFKIAATHD